MYSNISFKCNACDTNLVTNVAVPETNMEDNEGSSDTQTFDCDVCRKSYDVNIINRAGTLDVSIPGIQQNTIHVSNQEIEPEFIAPQQDWRIDYEWYANISQKTVFQYFTVSVTNIRDMLTLKVNDKNQTEMLNRMLLVQCVSTLEAYLSDTLISRVSSNHWLLQKLYNSDTLLNKEKHSMLAFLENNDLPLKRAKSYLDGLMYHNLPKIHMLYRSVLNVEFDFNGEENKNLLFMAIQDRHDFVHRNGKAKDDGSLHLIDKKYISNVLTVIESLVYKIEESLKESDDIPF